MNTNEARDAVQRIVTRLTGGKHMAASEEQVAQFERETGLSLPPLLREWFGFVNGVPYGAGTLISLTGSDFDGGYGALQMFATDRFRGSQRIPLADDGCGNDYYVDCSACQVEFEPVFFMETPLEPFEPEFVVSSTPWHFVRFFLLRDLEASKWPFDKDEVTSEDPSILSVSRVRLPWEAD